MKSDDISYVEKAIVQLRGESSQGQASSNKHLLETRIEVILVSTVELNPSTSQMIQN